VATTLRKMPIREQRELCSNITAVNVARWVHEEAKSRRGRAYLARMRMKPGLKLKVWAHVEDAAGAPDQGAILQGA